ncbi:MAG: 3-dehydroquinate synthase family protein, partial [Bacteroidota bacterium]|nr:3-dehydroquinate synthase family protein [Bacteroidota bacterium]
MKISIKISENLISRIYSGPQVFGEINKFLWNFCGKPSGVYLLVDENTHRFCLPKLLNEVPCLEKAEIIVTPSGEQNKDIRHVVQIWGKLMKMGAIRHSLLVNLGGGMITDLGGFAAATFKRGIPFIHIPTTLMGMTDAAIGGKTGVNIDLVKNQAGVYSNPEAVFIHPGFLETLKPDQMMSGLAEMIKYALILDAPLWKKFLKMDFRTLRDLQKEDPQWDDLICRLVKMKARVVSADYRENKYRRILNFGHTAGHALESFSISDGNK